MKRIDPTRIRRSPSRFFYLKRGRGASARSMASFLLRRARKERAIAPLSLRNKRQQAEKACLRIARTFEVPRPPARSADPGASRLSCRRPGGSATAFARRMAASSLPSSRPTCRGTTPRRRATSVQASASTPSTSSSRRASASGSSPTWTRTRRSSPPRWRRRAAPRRRRRLAGKLARKPCVVKSPVPRLRQ